MQPGCESICQASYDLVVTLRVHVGDGVSVFHVVSSTTAENIQRNIR